jgi:hypothetical protein
VIRRSFQEDRPRKSARSLRLSASLLVLIVVALAGPAATAVAHTVASQAPPFRLHLDVRSAEGAPAHVMPTYRAFEHAAADGGFDSTSPLVQGSGPIMEEPTNYLIFWQPTGSNTVFPSGYEAAIQQFFQDVSGTPYLQIETQYCDTSGHCPTGKSHYGGTWTDTNAYPAPDDGTSAHPLSDADLRQAVNDAIAANPTWNPPSTNTMYFVFMGYFDGTNPQEPIHSCTSSTECFAGLDTSPNESAYCAYHSHFTDGSGNDVIYASQPEDALGSCYPGSYNGGPYPNGAGNVDITLSAVSHEMFEANTDPDLANWRDSTGDEVADKCAYHYPWGDPNAGPFEPDGTNIVLNGDPYSLQTEWSNGAVVWNEEQPPGQNPGAPGCVKRYSQDSQTSVIPQSVDFGTVNGGDSATRTVNIKNTGLADMNVLYVGLGGGSSPHFSLTNVPPRHATIHPGSSLSVTLRFDSPSFTNGSFSGSLFVDVDDPQPRYTYTIPLDATAGYPVATLNKSSIAFGGVATDDRTSPNTLNDTVVLSNTGTAPLTLSSLAMGGANASDFTASSPVSLPAAIAPGSQITLSVGFDPSAPGARSATLSVTTDDPFTPVRHVLLSGTGLIPALGFSPASLLFPPTVLPAQVPGYTGSLLNLGVTNTGQAELIVDSQTTSGAPFSVPAASIPPSRYGPNTGYSLPVTFAPTATGKFTGTVNVTDTGNGEAPVAGSVSVCGEGVYRGIRVLAVNGSGTPWAMVSKLKLMSHNTSVGVNINVSDLALTGISSSCVPGQQEHYENQDLPAAPGGSGNHASYYTLAVSVGGKSSSLQFTLQPTEFKELVVTVK